MVVTPIFQFGTSRFLQAHADLFIHEAAEQGQSSGPITVIAGSGSATGRARLAALADPAGYPVVVRGKADGVPVERTIHVRSIARALDAQVDWQDLVRLFVEQAQFVISNTTEAGFAVPPGLELDLTKDADRAPPGFVPRLACLLAARWRAGGPGVVVLATELVGRNGDTLRGILRDLIVDHGGEPTFLRWLETECVFANSLVDRIVSAPLEPAGAVAEPYALWAIEQAPGLRVPCTHPAIRVVPDLEPYERLKIHILNLGHTVLAQHWLTHGAPQDATVRAMLDDAAHAAMLDAVYREEVLPGFAARNLGDEAARYRDTTLQRFRNPFLDHRIADIASGHVTKVERRIGGFIEWVGAESRRPMPRLAEILATVTKPAS